MAFFVATRFRKAAVQLFMDSSTSFSWISLSDMMCDEGLALNEPT